MKAQLLIVSQAMKNKQKVSIENRRKLNESLIRMAEGRNPKNVSDEVVNTYIQSVQQLKLKDEKMRTSFFRELSFMVLDQFIPIFIGIDWFQGLWLYHETTKGEAGRISVFSSLKSNSFYEKMTMISKLMNESEIRKSVWRLIVKDFSLLNEMIGEKLEFYQINEAFLEVENIGIIHSMNSEQFEILQEMTKVYNIKSTLTMKVMILLIASKHYTEKRYWENLASFMKEAIPKLLQELRDIDTKLDDKMILPFLRFWNKSLEEKTKEDTLKNMEYLPPFILDKFHFYYKETSESEKIIDYLFNGNNIRKYDSEGFSFTRKMAHIFHNTTHFYGSLDKLQKRCAILSLTTNEKARSFFLDMKWNIGTAKIDLIQWTQMISKFEEWKDEDIDILVKTFGYINFAYQSLPCFSLKLRTLNSLRPFVEEYHKEKEEQRNLKCLFDLHAQMSRKKVRRLRKMQKAMREEKRIRERNSCKSANILDYKFGKYVILQLNTKQELINEGKEMDNCVDTYFSKESSFIFSLRDGYDGPSLVTIELDSNLDIQQMELPSNVILDSDHTFWYIIDGWRKSFSNA